MDKYYPAKYYSFKPYEGTKYKGIAGRIKTLSYQANVNPEGFLSTLLKNLMPTDHFEALKGINLTKQTRILDVGCGNGDKYLYPLAEMGYKNLLGCDPYLPDTIHYPNGLVIKNTDVFEIIGAWDIIIYHHSFEHVSNPLENLQQVKKLLASDGVCIISTPTVSSYAWQHYGIYWYQIDAPRHFFIHSTTSIDLLAKEVDLQVVDTRWDSNYKQFVISERYKNDIPMNVKNKKTIPGFIKRKIEKLKYARMANRLNDQGRGDMAIFYLKTR
ncbi:MAG TPA: class I SAM-dependent methyltransferase [Chryseolinea sp.]|nr:class I SAM-dependent methyltransferase [Chryseolinea sp.]